MDDMKSNTTEAQPMDYISQGELVATETEVDSSNVKEDFSEDEFQKQLRETICKGSLDFDTWTSLITHIEKYYLDDIHTISLVYDSFLSKFPLCHVYWKNYADHKTRLCTVDKAVEIYERAVQSATYCVSLWVDYCNFSIAAFEDPFDIRRLFKRGMSFVGKDYLCHTLWDKYIEFECSQNQWSFLLKILIQTLRFPTKKLHNYYDNFKKFTAILEEERECLNISSMEVQAEVLPCGTIIMSETDIDTIIKKIQDPSKGSQCSEALQIYLATGEQFYHKACQLEEKIHHFETSLRRPFFHVKPLDDNHLASWHSYLDFIEKQEDFDWAVKIYEKCLIPCANYPEFWMRYVEFMETKGGRELSNFALERATQIFLENAPVIHIFNARFREQIGDVHGARAAFFYGDKDSNFYFVENVIKAANMEKRLGNLAAASSIYENALNLASERQKLHNVPVLYIHYSRLKHLIAGSADTAIDVILDGIKHVPHCRLLLEELIKFLMMHEGSKYMTVVDSIIANAITSGPDISQSLSTKDMEELSCLYLEYIDLCGTNDDVRKAWKRHIKLFPQLIRTTTSHNNPPNATHQLLDMAMEARKRMPLRQLPKGRGSGHLIQILVEEQELSRPENNGILPDQVVAEKLPNADGSDAQKEQLSFRNELLSREDVAEVESMQKFLHQSEDDVSGAMESTQGMACNPRIDESELIKLTNGSAKQSEHAASGSEESIQEVEKSTVLIIPSEVLQQSSSSSDIHEMEENELEEHPKPFHMERVSSSSGEKKSQDITTMELQEHGVAQKSSFSDGILELGPSEEIHVTSIAKSSPPTNSARIKNNVHSDEPENLSSSTSYQSPTRTQTECEVPANSGKNCPQNSISTAPGDTSPELHEHLHGLQQHDNLQEQCLTDKMGARVSVVNVNQGGSEYQSGAALGNVTGHARPVKYVENPSYVSAPLSESSPQPVISHPQALMSHCSTQTSEPHGLIQNSQEYNQMLQYQLQQQQQQQQQMLLHQQYQNQMLQLQNQYFQLQQQNQQVYQHQLPPPQQQNQPPQQQIQHHHYLQQTQQLQQSSYQLEQQQQLHPGQQEQCTQLLGQEHQTQFQQHNYQSEESVRQHNEQGYQLQLQQYQVQQQQVYQQFLQQQNLQQQQAYQQLLLQNQVQQQPPIYSTSTGNHPQGQGLIPLCDKDAAGLSENHKHPSPEGTGEPNTAVKCRPDFSPRPQHHKQSSHRASRMANTSLSPHSK